MADNLELKIHETPWWDGFEVAFFSRSGDKVSVAQPLEMRELQDGLMLTEPTARMSRDAMQGLFNQLWIAGFRPKDGTGNGGHIEALKYHLEDMRQLVFKSATPSLGKPEAP